MRIAPFAALLFLATDADAQAPRLAPLAQFGCESCEGPLLFNRVRTLAVSADRRIAVVDASEPHVRIFDANGRVEAAFARTGQGPAELQAPMGIGFAANGTVEVVDMSRRRLIRFGPRGEDKGSVALGGFANIGAFAPHGGHALATITASTSPVLKLVRVTGDKTVELRQVGAGDFPQRPGSFETLSVAVAPDGSFAVGDGVGAYVIRRYKPDGALAGEIRRTVARARRTPEEVRAITERRAANRAAVAARAGASTPGHSEGVPDPRERNWFEHGALRFDEKGRLWVLVGRGPAGRTVLDVFDVAGKYVGEVTVPARFTEYALGAGLLAAVVPDDSGFERVHVWSITDAETGR